MLRLTVEHIGRRGEGVARHDGGLVYLPYALPGETVMAECQGERGRVVEILEPRSDRIEPICPYYGVCGGCAVQSLPAFDYATWKRNLVVSALGRVGIEAPVEPLVDAHGAGRRRATFHARLDGPRAPPRVGFMEARAHMIVDIAACPILAPGMAGALPAARVVAAMLSSSGKPLDLVVTATETGLDLDLRGLGSATAAQVKALVAVAARLGLARLSNHGEVLVEARAPLLHMGRPAVAIPPGVFLQSTEAGEAALAARVGAGVAGAKRVADLFCGVGTFTLRLAEDAAVTAIDAEPHAIAALARAAASTDRLRQPRTEVRDLFKRPLSVHELSVFDAVVFDPPRAGAFAQSAELAKSTVPCVVAVSCDPGTFARDAAVLVAGGYGIESVTPVDQFRYAAHVEVVAVFRRAVVTAKKKRKLLS